MDAASFQSRMAALPEPQMGPEAPLWNQWRRQVWELGQSQPPETFQSWPPVYHCMLVSHWPMDYQLSQLQADDWRRWQPVIAATPYSCAADLHPGTSYSKDLINQAYHLLQWERCTGNRVEWLDRIVEIGGGYGAMALVCYRLGFRGEYVIFDLPEFSLLQRWFLSQARVPARFVTRLEHRPRQGMDLLIGIYSLSEMPFERRQQILDTWPAESYLLVYSQTWEDWNNSEWFRAWGASLEGYRWWHWRMAKENDRPDYYRVGEMGE